MPFDRSSVPDEAELEDSVRRMRVVEKSLEDERRHRKETLVIGAAAAGVAALGGGLLWLHRRKIAVAAAEASLNAAAAYVRTRRKIAAEIERRVGST